ncbi:MAG TPA: DUF4372 domain-containing protein [Prolixibacteraceae bacterium]|nr:DUF4372 domain-containing protein [Prolixibacteraceae bacterium]
MDLDKSTNFCGQPIFNQLLKFIDKGEVKKIAKTHGLERYMKKYPIFNIQYPISGIRQ